MKLFNIKNSIYLGLTFCVLAMVSAEGASLSVSTSAPTQDGADIYNLVTPATGSDIINGDRAAAGQTFLTDGNTAGYTLSSLTIYNTRAVSTSGGTWNLRLGTVSGTTFTTNMTDTVTVSGSALSLTGSGGDYITYTLTTPYRLLPNTLYGIDIVRTGAGNWLQYGETGNVFGDGQSYTSPPNGLGGPTVAFTSTQDRIFHLDMEALPSSGILFLVR
jgi:hypothetical protein